MKGERVVGTRSDEHGKRWFFEGLQQWSSLIGKCNWYDFTFIRLQGEYAPYSGRWELEFGLCGFLARVTYVFNESFNLEMKQRAEAMFAEIDEQAERDAMGANRDALRAERDALRESLQFPTAKQCDAVLDSLLENEWTGITRDDVRMWCRFISDALAPASQTKEGM